MDEVGQHGLSGDEVNALADRLLQARRERQLLTPPSGEQSLTMGDAYAVQAEVTRNRLAGGERIVGWKLGYTSEAMRAQMNIAAPNFGPLTNAMVLASGAAVSDLLLQPRVEPEIGLHFGRPVPENASVADVLAATDYAFAVLEVVDSVFRDYKFRIEDNTADGSSAAQVVIGPRLATHEALDQLAVTFRRGDEVLGEATGAAASGHPALGVVWLAEQLARSGRRIEAGQFVITGGLTSAAVLHPGDRLVAVVGDVEVSVLRSPSASNAT